MEYVSVGAYQTLHIKGRQYCVDFRFTFSQHLGGLFVGIDNVHVIIRQHHHGLADFQRCRVMLFSVLLVSLTVSLTFGGLILVFYNRFVQV